MYIFFTLLSFALLSRSLPLLRVYVICMHPPFLCLPFSSFLYYFLALFAIPPPPPLWHFLLIFTPFSCFLPSSSLSPSSFPLTAPPLPLWYFPLIFIRLPPAHLSSNLSSFLSVSRTQKRSRKNEAKPFVYLKLRVAGTKFCIGMWKGRNWGQKSKSRSKDQTKSLGSRLEGEEDCKVGAKLGPKRWTRTLGLQTFLYSQTRIQDCFVWENIVRVASSPFPALSQRSDPAASFRQTPFLTRPLWTVLYLLTATYNILIFSWLKKKLMWW